MAHLALVDGTAYEIDGGKTLIDGVAYSIDKGKTLVGGTAYEVGFGGKFTMVVEIGPITPNIMGSFYGGQTPLPTLPSGYDTCTHAMINGVLYEVNKTNTQGMVTYTPTDTSVMISMYFNTGNNQAIYRFTVAGTYIVQFGTLS